MYKDTDVNMSLLLDFYGDLLPEGQREALDFYYNDDMTLAEISDEVGISRQGVRDRIVKGEKMLFEYEEKLGTVARFSGIKKDVSEIIGAIEKLRNADNPQSGKLQNEIYDAAVRLKDRL